MAKSRSHGFNPTSITWWRGLTGHRWLHIVLALLILSGLILYFGFGQANSLGGNKGMTRTADDSIAVVNDVPVPRQAYQNQWDNMRRFFGGNELQSVQGQGMVLGQLIDSALETSMAKARHLTVPDSEIDKQIETMKSSGGKKLTDSEFDQMLQQSGSSVSDVRDQLKQSLLPQVLQESVQGSVHVTEADIRKQFTQVQVREILVSKTKMPAGQAKTRADKILQQLKAGADFAKLANQYTDDPGNSSGEDPKTHRPTKTAPKGGFYDWKNVTEYVPSFGNACLALKPGQISDVVTSPEYGYFIIKLLGIRTNLPKDFKKTLPEKLTQEKSTQANKAVQDMLVQARATAKIVWNDPSLKWKYDYTRMQGGMMGTANPALRGLVLAELRTTVKQAPDDAAAALQLGQILYPQMLTAPAGPQRDALRTEIENAYEIGLRHAEDQQTRLTLAQLYIQSKKPADALRHYEMVQRLLRWDKTTTTLSTHQTLEKAFTDLGQPAMASEEKATIVRLQAQAKKEAADAAVAKLAATKKAAADAAAKKLADAAAKRAAKIPPPLVPGAKPAPSGASPSGTLNPKPATTIPPAKQTAPGGVAQPTKP